MLVRRRGNIVILPPMRPGMPSHPSRPGKDVAEELGGRPLLRYIVLTDVGRYRAGTTREVYTTPTAYTPEEAPSWLNVPDVHIERPYVVMLDPARIDLIQGPMWVAPGLGIQYILPHGFPEAAIVVLGAPTGHWEQPVR